MGMSQEQAAATLHAAKMAQLNALGHNFDKMPSSLLPPHLDLSKMRSHSPDRMQTGGGVTIEATKVPTSYANIDRNSADIRRDDSQPMDLGSENLQKDTNNGGNNNASRGNSSGEDEYGSDDDGDREKN